MPAQCPCLVFLPLGKELDCRNPTRVIQNHVWDTFINHFLSCSGAPAKKLADRIATIRRSIDQVSINLLLLSPHSGWVQKAPTSSEPWTPGNLPHISHVRCLQPSLPQGACLTSKGMKAGCGARLDNLEKRSREYDPMCTGIPAGYTAESWLNNERSKCNLNRKLAFPEEPKQPLV